MEEPWYLTFARPIRQRLLIGPVMRQRENDH